MLKPLKYWIEAMRLRTLPVSVAGVLTAMAVAVLNGTYSAVPAFICLVFAILCQIASNFANEYFDYAEGRDRPGREGPRRGVTEGEISPRAMKRATYITLLLACCVGLSLVAWGGWWLVAVGALIAVGVFAYSAGPYPLSTHGWGEVGVIFFFGIIPVNFTYYVQCLEWSADVVLASLAVGLMGANVLIVNNYRDRKDDIAVAKNTLCVRFGRRAMLWLYGVDCLAATLCLLPLWLKAGWASVAIAIFYLTASALIIRAMNRRSGASLTPLLGMTAVLMFVVSASLLVYACL